MKRYIPHCLLLHILLLKQDQCELQLTAQQGDSLSIRDLYPQEPVIYKEKLQRKVSKRHMS